MATMTSRKRGPDALSDLSDSDLLDAIFQRGAERIIYICCSEWWRLRDPRSLLRLGPFRRTEPALERDLGSNKDHSLESCGARKRGVHIIGGVCMWSGRGVGILQSSVETVAQAAQRIRASFPHRQLLFYPVGSFEQREDFDKIHLIADGAFIRDLHGESFAYDSKDRFLLPWHRRSEANTEDLSHLFSFVPEYPHLDLLVKDAVACFRKLKFKTILKDNIRHIGVSSNGMLAIAAEECFRGINEECAVIATTDGSNEVILTPEKRQLSALYLMENDPREADMKRIFNGMLHLVEVLPGHSGVVNADIAEWSHRTYGIYATQRFADAADRYKWNMMPKDIAIAEDLYSSDESDSSSDDTSSSSD